MDILLLNETEVRQLLDLDALLDELAESFKALSSGLVEAPRRQGVSVPGTGDLLTMPAYQQGREIAVKLVSVFHGNEQLGIPTHQALICLFGSQTGTPLAFIDGTAITALRTAGAAALSTRLLARPESRVLAIVGAGVQGRAQPCPRWATRRNRCQGAPRRDSRRGCARSRCRVPVYQRQRADYSPGLARTRDAPHLRWLRTPRRRTRSRDNRAKPSLRRDTTSLRAIPDWLRRTRRSRSQYRHRTRRNPSRPETGAAISHRTHRLQSNGPRLRRHGRRESGVSTRSAR